MAIKITQPFQFDSTNPNFERDIIDSSQFASGDPFVISSVESDSLSKKYDIGHVVWDSNTRRHYVILPAVIGDKTYYCLGVPTASNTIQKLNEVNNEILYLKDELEINMPISYCVYIPISSQPSDWETHWDKYYIKASYNEFVKNDDSEFKTTLKYFLMVIM